MSRVLIVGGGLSGLAAGYRLLSCGHDVVVIEAATEVGGSVASERHGRYVVETGAVLVNTSCHRFVSLSEQLGLGDQPRVRGQRAPGCRPRRHAEGGDRVGQSCECFRGDQWHGRDP
jgi:protoporphyrinogen oxidase